MAEPAADCLSTLSLLAKGILQLLGEVTPMLRTSSYTIYVDLPGNADELLLVHSYTGAFDKVSRKVATYVRSLEQGRPPKAALRRLEPGTPDRRRDRQSLLSDAGSPREARLPDADDEGAGAEVLRLLRRQDPRERVAVGRPTSSCPPTTAISGAHTASRTTCGPIPASSTC